MYYVVIGTRCFKFPTQALFPSKELLFLFAFRFLGLPTALDNLFGPTVRKLSILVIETSPSKLFSYSIFEHELGGTLLAIQV